jgi:hypothetical protein
VAYYARYGNCRIQFFELVTAALTALLCTRSVTKWRTEVVNPLVYVTVMHAVMDNINCRDVWLCSCYACRHTESLSSPGYVTPSYRSNTANRWLHCIPRTFQENASLSPPQMYLCLPLQWWYSGISRLKLNAHRYLTAQYLNKSFWDDTFLRVFQATPSSQKKLYNFEAEWLNQYNDEVGSWAECPDFLSIQPKFPHGKDVKLFTHIQPVPKLMRGAVPPLLVRLHGSVLH